MLLIIDEFQEFAFVKDDKIRSDAALLLDRLVRQGRAFSIHVLLEFANAGRACAEITPRVGSNGGAIGSAMQRVRRI
ncbi:MAG: hypothetical protein R3C99_17725 [Pirellulaceae bacterium]